MSAAKMLSDQQSIASLKMRLGWSNCNMIQCRDVSTYCQEKGTFGCSSLGLGVCFSFHAGFNVFVLNKDWQVSRDVPNQHSVVPFRERLRNQERRVHPDCTYSCLLTYSWGGLYTLVHFAWMLGLELFAG